MDKKKMGRPTDNLKPYKIGVKLDQEAKDILNAYCKQESVSVMEAAWRGIKRLKPDLEKSGKRPHSQKSKPLPKNGSRRKDSYSINSIPCTADSFKDCTNGKECNAMNKDTEWNEFLSNLLSRHLKDLQATREYEFREQRGKQIDEMLETNLTKGEKDMVDEALFELGLTAERETEQLYRQEMKDCVWLLKNLGVLA